MPHQLSTRVSTMLNAAAHQHPQAARGADGDAPGERVREALALGAGAVALAVVAFTTLVVFRLQPMPMPIAGDGSIGRHSAITSAFVAFVALPQDA